MLRISLTIVASISFLFACSSEQTAQSGEIGDVPIDPEQVETNTLITPPNDATALTPEPVPTDAVAIEPAPTDALIVPPADAPVVPPADAPVVPPADAPVIPPVDAPVVPPLDAPVVPPADAPVVPPADAPVIPPVDAPVVPPAEAPAPEPVPQPTPPAPIPAPAPVAPPTTPATIAQPRFDVEFIGEDIFVSINGQRVAKEHLRRTEDSVEVIGTTGQVLQTIPIPQPKEHPPVMIGLRFETPGKALTKHLGADVSNCALVVAVMENGPGYLVGIEDFDLVTAIDGKAPATPEAIRARLKTMAPGDSIVLSVRRGSTTKDYSLQSKAWKHVPLPAPLQPPPFTRNPSPMMPGTPTMPADTNSNGRPAAAPQRTATPGS